MTNSSSVQNFSKAFLMMLDPNTKDFHFRVFIDDKTITESKSHNFKGSFETHAEKFQSLNDQSRGVFVVINEGGQRDAEITRIRAVFADTDGAPLHPIIETLEPHMVIKTSPGRWHVYWLVDDNFPLDQFKPIQAAIAQKFGTDKSVTNPSRVMRLPGFFHRKTQPLLCQFRSYNVKLPRYSKDQIINGLGLSLKKLKSRRDVPIQTFSSNKKEILTELEDLLPYINRLDHDTWIKVSFVIADELGEDGRELYVRWSRGDLEMRPPS